MTHKEIIRNVIKSYITEIYKRGNGDDECYTRYIDVENELSNYDLNGKVIYCPCDDPSFSAFWKYFYNNFHNLGLKCLYATYFSNEPMLWKYDGENIEKKPIESGRFQDNGDVIDLCDIVATNPPFSESQTEQLINMVLGRGKDIITVGRKSITKSNKMFGYIKSGQLRNGYTAIGKFMHPDGTEGKYSTAWYTTLPVNRGEYHSGRKYADNEYQKYDDYDAIEVPRFDEIPDDYEGMMGVPNNGGGFLRVHNPDQYELGDKIRRPKIKGVPVSGDRMLIRRKQQKNENVKKTVKLTESDLHEIIKQILHIVSI